MNRDGYALGHLIGYATLEEWERAAPNNRLEPRASTVVYLMLYSEMEYGNPPSLRSALSLQRLDQAGNVHYWQLHVCTVLSANGVLPMFEHDLPLVESGQRAAEIVRLWLAEQGFTQIVTARIANDKNTVLLNGHTELLRFDKVQGWVRPLKEN